jgi:AcrR family transcriptional regulator
MGKTKTHLDHDQKRAEILRVARRLFLEEGFETTSVGRIADEAKVAPNTLYWYFTDKDALLIAVLDALVGKAFRDFERRKAASIQEQLLWVIRVLTDAQRLITTVHSRMATVESVRIWHEGFHALIEATLEEQLRSRALARHHEAEAARVTAFIVEGMLAHPSPRSQQRQLIDWLVSLVERDVANIRAGSARCEGENR